MCLFCGNHKKSIESECLNGPASVEGLGFLIDKTGESRCNDTCVLYLAHKQFSEDSFSIRTKLLYRFPFQNWGCWTFSLCVCLSHTHTVPAYHTWQPAGLITIFLLSLHPGDVQLLPVWGWDRTRGKQLFAPVPHNDQHAYSTPTTPRHSHDK